MTMTDTCCSIHPYFQVQPGQLPAFRRLCERFIEKTRPEPGCLYYGFSVAGDVVHCREGYVDAAALLRHVENVAALIEEALQISAIARLEVHGPAAELEKLRGPLANLSVEFYTFECGFRR